MTGRQLKACNRCGRPVPITKRGPEFCERCQVRPDVHIHGPRPYNDPAYQANRKQVLAEEDCCALCGEPFTPADPATVDHIVPVSSGGGHERSNLRAAHRRCNARRGG